MRRITMLVSMAAVAHVGFPAHAAKYNCQISQGGTVLKQCSIDPTTSTSMCTQSLGNNLVGFCNVSKSDDDAIETLLCAFSVPTAAASAVKQHSPDSMRAAMEQPGFFAASFVNLNPAATRPSVFETTYSETSKRSHLRRHLQVG